MAIYSNTLAWKIPWTEEPSRLQSTGSQRSQTRLMTEHADGPDLQVVVFFFFFKQMSPNSIKNLQQNKF